MSDPQVRLKVMWDYGAFPLWQEGGMGAGVRPPSLPRSLVDDLQAWSDRWGAICWGRHGPDSPHTPKPTAEQIAVHNAEGRSLTERVKEALGGNYEVTFWPDE